MTAEHFSARLKELREAAGLSRAELAAKAGLKVNGVRDLEQGVNQPRLATALALADALDVNLYAFLDPPGSPPRRTPGRPRKPTP